MGYETMLGQLSSSKNTFMDINPVTLVTVWVKTYVEEYVSHAMELEDKDQIQNHQIPIASKKAYMIATNELLWLSISFCNK